MTDKEKYILEHYLITKNNAIIEYTDEDVTTIERNLNTAIEV